MKPRRRLWVLLAVLAALGATFYGLFPGKWRPYVVWLRGQTVGHRSRAAVLRKYGPAAEARLRPHFRAKDVPYPPRLIALLVFKREQKLELWALKAGAWAHLRTYAILACSGGPGPKLLASDGQVPEGMYRVFGLDPNSGWHLALQLYYPNDFDREMALHDGREEFGYNVCIHGKGASPGCVSLGDDDVEELFLLAAAVGRNNVRILIAPNDLRHGQPVVRGPRTPPWADELYRRIRAKLRPFEGGS